MEWLRELFVSLVLTFAGGDVSDDEITPDLLTHDPAGCEIRVRRDTRTAMADIFEPLPEPPGHWEVDLVGWSWSDGFRFRWRYVCHYCERGRHVQ